VRRVAPEAAIAGLLFGFSAHLTASIAGAALGHALLNAGLFVVWPELLA
jgi:membrane protease YdiL (CAAX protease family)